MTNATTQRSIKRKVEGGSASQDESSEKMPKLAPESAHAAKKFLTNRSIDATSSIDWEILPDDSNISTCEQYSFPPERPSSQSDRFPSFIHRMQRQSHNPSPMVWNSKTGCFSVFDASVPSKGKPLQATSTSLANVTIDFMPSVTANPSEIPTSSLGSQKGGRPKTKPPPATGPPTKRLRKSTVLRVNHPVEARLPMDIWNRIYFHCKPDLLFKLRLVCKGFKEALSGESVWEQSLIQEFGPSLPEVPEGLSYMHYANLLTVRGCQACGDASTAGGSTRGGARKTYWAFKRRYCERCLNERVLFGKVLKKELLESPLARYVDRVFECIPSANYDTWGHYKSVGDPDPRRVSPHRLNTRTIGFLRSDVSKLKYEFEVFLNDWPSDVTPTRLQIEGFFGWRSLVNPVIADQLKAVEDFVEEKRIARLKFLQDGRDARFKFYQQKALAADPPIELDVFNQCRSFLAASGSSRPVADLERSWATLLPKVRKEVPEIRERLAKEAEEAQQQFRAERAAKRDERVRREQARQIMAFAWKARREYDVHRTLTEGTPLFPFPPTG